MTVLKVIGVIAGVGIIALIGGAFYFARKAKSGLKDLIDQAKEKINNTDAEPEAPISRPAPSGSILDTSDLPDVLRKILDESDHFRDVWPADQKTIESMAQDDVVVFAVESNPIEGYTEKTQELISAKVLSVESDVVRARVLGPVAHAEHHGSHAGHGFRVGDLLDVPRSKVLLAARRAETPKDEYNGHGEAAQTFKPSEITKQTYLVGPGTPYDLVLPYRTPELEWHVDRELVKLIHVGHDGLIEQIMFSEDSMRGPVTVRVQDRDPKEGLVHVARFDFAIAP